ncbi:hypothetical protein YC2023_046546 [Brassica napus]
MYVNETSSVAATRRGALSYHPQTQLLRLVAVDSVSKQSYKPLQIASSRSEPLKFKSWFQLAFAVADGCGRIITSRTNLLKLLETATTRIRKRPQPQPPPLRLNQSDP